MDQERSMRGGVFERQKDSIVLGTYESSAFILSLRDPEEFSSIHSFGCHLIPHIGVYGKDYTVSLPMVLLSLPATQRVIQKLPTDLLGALDLDHLLTPTQLTQQEVTIPSFGDETKTTTQELRENVLTFQRIYTNSGVSPERIVAKALVDCVIHSAQKRVTPPIFTFGASLPNGIGYSPSIKQQTYLRVNNSGVGVDGMRMEWREIKRASSVSVRCLKESTFRSTSGVSMESEGYVSAMSDCFDFPRTERRKVSFHVGEQRPFMTMDTVEEVDEEELRIVAKKLVMKILHMACKEVESLYRRSSIEYLIANTKRMKIEESPSPPPVLFNIAEEDQDGTDCSDGKRPNPFSDLRPSSSERSPTPEHLLLRRLGKKRGRSGSHEVSGLREFVETSRRSKVVRKIINFKERIMGGIQQYSGGSVKSPNDDSSSQSGDEGTSFTSLVSNLSRMTIGGPPQESDTESELASNADESFTILNAITVSEDPLAGLRDEANTADSSKRFHFQDPTTSIHQRSNHLGAATLFPTTNSTHNTPTTSPLAVQSLSSSSPLMNGTSSSSIESSVVPDMDIFVVIHSRPTPGECQKFLCNNTNEVNLMYHCWMYPNTPFDPSLSITGKLEMGVFEPSYVEPVHLDLQDAGVPFYYIDERTVCIHHCCFSPENAQLQLTQVPDHSPILHSFFSAARRGSRRVATFHVIPSSHHAEQSIRQCIQNCSNLGQLLTRLKATFPNVGQTVLNLVNPQ